MSCTKTDTLEDDSSVLRQGQCTKLARDVATRLAHRPFCCRSDMPSYLPCPPLLYRGDTAGTGAQRALWGLCSPHPHPFPQERPARPSRGGGTHPSSHNHHLVLGRQRPGSGPWRPTALDEMTDHRVAEFRISFFNVSTIIA